LKQLIFITFIAITALFSCKTPGQKDENGKGGTIRIIHAGSLTVPVKEAAEVFRKDNPEVRILTEAWGSKAGARRISDLGVPCDVYISADYRVIDIFLLPEHASWNIPFAGNEMSIVYTPSSRYAREVNASNWHRVLLRDDVVYGRSDPDSDPCGVRAVLTSKLAGILYEEPSLPDELLSRHHNMIRPKETDLIALLEQGALDYIFLYRSVAEQHGLEYVVLPDSLNLKDPSLNEWYARVETEVAGTRPGETLTERGEAMVYGITVPKKARNRETAMSFVKFFLEEDGGQAIMERNGQNPMVPYRTETYDKLPEELKRFAIPAE